MNTGSYTSIAFATEGDYAENAKVNAITREDLFIPDDVAVEIAKFFIKDMIMTGAVGWNNETEVINTTIMYSMTRKILLPIHWN